MNIGLILHRKKLLDTVVPILKDLNIDFTTYSRVLDTDKKFDFGRDARVSACLNGHDLLILDEYYIANAVNEKTLAKDFKEHSGKIAGIGMAPCNRTIRILYNSLMGIDFICVSENTVQVKHEIKKLIGEV